MRTFVLALGLIALGTLGLAGEPPGSIVIRPGGSGAVPVTPNEAPDKPGFIVIRPQGTARDDFPSPNRPILVGARPPAGTGLLVPVPTPRTQPAPDEKDDGKLVLETWDAAFIKGNKVGHFHVVVREYERDGKKFRYGIKTQKLTVSRFGQVVEQWAEDATMETLDGAILVTRMRQGIGKDQMLSLTGTVSGPKLSVKIEGAAGGTQDVPWPDNVVGIVKEATLLKDRKPKPGESFDYLYYEGRLNRAIKFTVSIKDYEEVAIYEGEKPRKTLRFLLAMEPIKTPNGGEFRLPVSTMWADAETLEPLKMESDMPTLGGKMTVLRTTKEAALRAPAKIVELFDVQSIRLDRAVPNIHDAGPIVYKVTLTGDLPLDKAFASDDREGDRRRDQDFRVARDPGAGARHREKSGRSGQRIPFQLLLHRLGCGCGESARSPSRGRLARKRNRLAKSSGRRNVGPSQYEVHGVQPSDGDVLERGENALRRLHGVRDVGGRHVPGAGRSIPHGPRARVCPEPRRQAVPRVSHVVRGLRRRSLGRSRCHARPRLHRSGARENHRCFVARGEIVRAAAPRVERARVDAEVRSAPRDRRPAVNRARFSDPSGEDWGWISNGSAEHREFSMFDSFSRIERLYSNRVAEPPAHALRPVDGGMSCQRVAHEPPSTSKARTRRPPMMAHGQVPA